MQWLGVAVVFGAALFDFITEKFCKKPESLQALSVSDVVESTHLRQTE